MSACDKQLEQYLAVLPSRTIGAKVESAIDDTSQPSVPEQAPGKKVKAEKIKKPKKPKGNAPAFELKSELRRIAGVDLTTIDGIDVMTAQTILAEVGTDMSAFKTEDNFASCGARVESALLGLTPSKDLSAGKVVRRSRGKVKNRVATSLRIAATSLLNSKSYLGARYRRLQRELPTKTATVKAMGHYLALLVYRMLTKGQAWVDQGAARFEHKREQLELASITSRAAARGLKLVPIEAQIQ